MAGFLGGMILGAIIGFMICALVTVNKLGGGDDDTEG